MRLDPPRNLIQSTRHFYDAKSINFDPVVESSPVPISSSASRLWLHLSSLVTGSGLGVLLSLAGASLDPFLSAAAVSVGALLSLLWGYFMRQSSPQWLCLFSATLNLVLTLSVGLSLFARLCPPEGKELALIPAYFLLCIARTRVGTAWPAQIANALFLVAFCVLTLSDTQEQGFQGFSGASDEPAVAFVFVCVAVVYDSISQWCRLSEDLVYFQRWPNFPVHGLAIEAGSWGVPRYLVLYLVSLIGGGALPYLFLAPLPTYSAPSAPNYLGACYGFVLLLSSMCFASRWFQCLQCHSRSPQHLTRFQHIFNLLLVGSAWAFPIHHPFLALLLYCLGGVVCVLGSLFSVRPRNWIQP
jgi:hypothetical protein